MIGALGADVFAGSSAEKNGIAYMLGGTGGYLAGYVLAVLALGLAARRGWDRSVPGMALALLIGNALIYVPGLAWLHQLIAGGLFDAATYASVWSADARLGPDALPDRRRPEAGPGRAPRPRALEAGRERAGLNLHWVQVPPARVFSPRRWQGPRTAVALRGRVAARGRRHSGNRTAPMWGRLRLRWA